MFFIAHTPQILPFQQPAARGNMSSPIEVYCEARGEETEKDWPGYLNLVNFIALYCLGVEGSYLNKWPQFSFPSVPNVNAAIDIPLSGLHLKTFKVPSKMNVIHIFLSNYVKIEFTRVSMTAFPGKCLEQKKQIDCKRTSVPQPRFFPLQILSFSMVYWMKVLTLNTKPLSFRSNLSYLTTGLNMA